MSDPPHRPGMFLPSVSWFSEVEAEGRPISRERKAWRQSANIKNRQAARPLTALWENLSQALRLMSNSIKNSSAAGHHIFTASVASRTGGYALRRHPECPLRFSEPLSGLHRLELRREELRHPLE